MRAEKLNRGSQLLLASVLVSNIGLGGQVLATGVLLYADTKSALTFASTLGIGFVLGLLGQLFGGSVLDRGSPRSITVFVNISRGVVVIVAAVVFVSTHNFLPVALSFIYMSILRPIYRASSFAFTPLVAETPQLPRVNAIRTGLLQVGQLLGLSLVSVILTFGSPEIAFAANGLWFILGGICILLIDNLPQHNAVRAIAYANPAAAFREWSEAVKVLCRVPSVSAHFLISSSSPIITALVNLYIVPYNKILGGTPLGLALLDGGFATGAIIAAVALSRFHLLVQTTTRAVNVALLGAALAFLLMGTTVNLPVAAFCSLSIGAVTTVIIVQLDTALQLRSAKELMGRMAVIQDAVASIIAVVLVPIIGGAIDSQGVNRAILWSAFIAVGYLVVAMIACTRHVFGAALYTEEVSSSTVKQKKT